MEFAWYRNQAKGFTYSFSWIGNGAKEGASGELWEYTGRGVLVYFVFSYKEVMARAVDSDGVVRCLAAFNSRFRLA